MFGQLAYLGGARDIIWQIRTIDETSKMIHSIKFSKNTGNGASFTIQTVPSVAKNIA